MAELLIFDNKITSVFQLLGTKENDISYSVGYGLAKSNRFFENFLKYLGIATPFEPSKIRIHLQAHEKDKGFTDFEIIQEGEFHIIIEAKRGWNFPHENQITKYANRNSFRNSTAKDKRILIFNESIPAYTSAQFGITQIMGIPVQVISWIDIQNIVKKSKSIGRDADNRMLDELNVYLDKISTMQKKDSNLVYVVSLGGGKPDGWLISWRDVINKYMKYFHPVGGGKGGWPSEPPNYIAFRYNGILQSIHHIDNYQVSKDPSIHFPGVSHGLWGQPHYIYDLGPAIRPEHTVKTGKKVVRSMRVWAALDLLLTSQTIEEARDRTKSERR